MRNFLKAVAVLLLALSPFSAQAASQSDTYTILVSSESSVAQVFDAVGEVSNIATFAANTELTIFVSGTYTADNRVWLQREVGSPGSGSWENTLLVTGPNANARVVTSYLTGPNRETYRLALPVDGTSGAVVAYATDKNVLAEEWVRDSTQFVHYDELAITGDTATSATVPDANVYLTHDGAGNAGTELVITSGIQEGGGTIISGATDTNAACISTVLNEMAFAPTDGWGVVEVRLRADIVSGFLWVGLADIACANNDAVNFTFSTGTVTAATAFADMVGIGRDGDSATPADWMPLSAILDVEGSNALEVFLATAVAGRYVTLRTEIDPLGNAYFYIDGVLLAVEPLAVTPANYLVPYVEVAATSGAAAITAILDYILFVGPRPTT